MAKLGRFGHGSDGAAPQWWWQCGNYSLGFDVVLSDLYGGLGL